MNDRKSLAKLRGFFYAHAMTHGGINLEASLAASVPSAQEIAANPIWKLLADAGIDWTMSVAEVEARQGKRFDEASQSWRLSYPTTHAAFANMLNPVSARLWQGSDPRCPVGYLDGHYHFGDDVRENVRLALEQLTPYLGDGALYGVGEPLGSSNVIGRQWKCGRASFKIYGFPPELQGDYGRNSYHERDPRLKVATTFSISPGFRLVLAEEEKAMVESGVPIWSYPPTRSLDEMYEHRDGLQFPYHRYSERPHPILADSVCLSTDGKVVITGSPQKLTLIERSTIQSVTVDRMSRARGGAYSSISLKVTNARSKDGHLPITIMVSAETEGCTRGGEALAEALGVEYDLWPVIPNY